MKAMHAICHYVGTSPDNVRSAGELGLYKSGYWRIDREEAPTLKGGWLYLHETSTKPAYFIARIEEVGEPDHEGKYDLTIRRQKIAVTVTWPGEKANIASFIRIVPADRQHELEAANA